MKIAQIAPLMESVPPRLYGGTERVVSYLTEDLVAQGHEVTLFASGDSITAANLVPCCTQALRLDTAVTDVVPYYMLMLEKVRSRAAEFDVLHFHIDHFHFPIFRHLPIPSLTTLHGRQDSRDCLPFFAGFRDMPLVSISDSQRAPLPHANFSATIHLGIPQNLHEANYRPNGGYLAFMGRISPEKGPVDAVRIAQSLGIPLKIAAKVDKVDESYFREVVQPMLSTEGVEFIGEINEKDKGLFLRDAIALLFPICWPEPFGLVMIEAMACGTPVLAYRAGAVSEVVDEGITGMIVENIDQARIAAVQVARLDRRKVRRRFEERFTARRMANDYVRVYRGLVQHAAQPQRGLKTPVDGRIHVNGNGRFSDVSCVPLGPIPELTRSAISHFDPGQRFLSPRPRRLNREIEVAVGFDPTFLCIFCDQPVGALSMGGPMVCPACDCGYNRDGTQWTMEEAERRYANARRRTTCSPS